MKRLMLCALLLIATPLLAQWKEGGEPVPDTKWRKSDGPFGVMLLLSDEPQKFVDDWNKPETPALHSTDVAKRGTPIGAFVLFVGCKEVEGHCDATVDFTVLRPDGSEYASQKDAEMWKEEAPGTNLQLSVANLGIRIEPQDPAGKYLVRAVAHDRNAKRNVSVEQTFTVSD